MTYYRVEIHGTVVVEAEDKDEAAANAQEQSNWEDDAITVISATDVHELDEDGDEIEEPDA